jgi:hypothetical protein
MGLRRRSAAGFEQPKRGTLTGDVRVSNRLTYEIVTVTRVGASRPHAYSPENELRPGDIVVLGGRFWLIAELDDGKATATPARYRLVLRHPEGRDEAGAFRRFRPGAPRLGHVFTTAPEGNPVAWVVVDERPVRDEQGEPYLELVAERDFSEVEELPDHELEHALAERGTEIPEAARETLARAEEAGLAVELVALEPGEAPDWSAAERLIDALILEELEDDLIEMCGVRPGRDPRETWLATVQERLRSDLRRFRDDIEGDHDEIEEWDFLMGRVFAAIGSFEDESDPDRGYGWMCRLVDAEALGAAGFDRVRKAELAA